jgi:hypothetical protein
VAVDDEIGSYCVTKADGTYRCWGPEASDAAEPRPLPDAIYQRVQLTRYGLIGLTEDGRLHAAEFTIPESPSKVVSFRETDMWTNAGVCSLHADGSFRMVLHNPDRTEDPTLTQFIEGRFSHVSCAYEGFYAAIRTDGTVLWREEATPPGNDFAELALSIGIFCGLRTNGTISCHPPISDCGSRSGGPCVGPDLPAFPAERYRSITATGAAVCAIDEQDTLVCKRYDGQDVAAPPGRYTFAQGGKDVLCAVRVDGSTACFRHGGGGWLNPDEVAGFAPVEPPVDPGW